MFQNLKVDMIYYKINTDFELEFNLCGCCRMRLLNDKVADKKSLVQHLSRAVSRSTVILIAGALFGADGLISLVAHIIGKDVEQVDNKVYGIQSNDAISIIRGSVPLVTPEGYFGGCIIESGPQTMILLSDNKTVRKSIMQTLIHPYMEELYAASGKKETPTAPEEPPVSSDPAEPAPVEDPALFVPAPETPVVEEPDLPEEPDSPEEPEEEHPTEIVSQSPEEPAEEPTEEESSFDEKTPSPAESESEAAANIAKSTEPLSKPTPEVTTKKIDLSEGMIFETEDPAFEESFEEDDGVEFIMEPEKMKKSRTKSNQSVFEYQTDFSEQDDEYHAVIDSDSPKPLTAFSRHLIFLVILVVLFAALAILAYSLFYLPLRQNYSPIQYLHDIFERLFG